MDRNKIVGIIIIIAILLSLILVGYHAVNTTIDKENIIQTEQSMDESELNQSLMEGFEDSNLTTININLNQKTGGSKIEFADNATEIYKVISKDDKNFTTNITTNQENGTVGVIID